jgi:hypothetical protein
MYLGSHVRRYAWNSDMADELMAFANNGGKSASSTESLKLSTFVDLRVPQSYDLYPPGSGSGYCGSTLNKLSDYSAFQVRLLALGLPHHRCNMRLSKPHLQSSRRLGSSSPAGDILAVMSL